MVPQSGVPFADYLTLLCLGTKLNAYFALTPPHYALRGPQSELSRMSFPGTNGIASQRIQIGLIEGHVDVPETLIKLNSLPFIRWDRGTLWSDLR